MTLYALYSVYNEEANLPRAMDSVEATWDAVVHVVVDGKYPDFPGEFDLSTDATRKLARNRGFLITCVDQECEKRTAGLRFIDEQAVDGDYVLVLDADETIDQFFGWPAKVGSFLFTRDSNPEVSYGRCRLYAWEPGLHFKDRHYDIYRASGELLSSLEDAPEFSSCGFGTHYDKAHSPERVACKQTYYKALRSREGHPAAARRA